MLSRCNERLGSDYDLLGQLLIELDLLIAQLLDIGFVLLSFLQVLAVQVMLHNLPLLGQLYAILKSLVQLLILYVKLRLALRGNIRLTRQNAKSLVSDIKVGKKLRLLLI